MMPGAIPALWDLSVDGASASSARPICHLPDVAFVMETFMHGLAQQPPRRAHLARETTGSPGPIVVWRAAHLFTEAMRIVGELVEYGLEFAVVVRKPLGPEIVEERLQQRVILGADPVQTY